MSKVLELKQQEESLITQMRSVLDESKDKELTTEQRSKIDKIDADIDNVRAKIKAQELIDAADAQRADSQRQAQERSTKKATEEEILAVEKKAFLGYLRGHGISQLTPEEATVYREALQRGQTKGTDSEGGYLTPEYFSTEVIKRLKSYGGILEAAKVINTTDGNTLHMSTLDDTASKAVIIAENANVGTTNLTFGRVSIGSFEYTTRMFKVSNMLLRDSITDVPGMIYDAMAERFGRGTQEHFTVGTGSGQPQGLITALLAIASDGGVGVTTASATAFTGDELIDLVHSVDPLYRRSSSFMLNDTSLREARKLKDGQGNYLWQMGDITKGVPSSLLGYPIVENYEMADPAANAAPIAFGDIEKAYTIRRVGSITLKRANELYLETNEVGFVGFAAFDGKLVQPNAAKVLKNAAV